jgi:hypothetical protein
MNELWLRLPIYLDGTKRFDANPGGPITSVDAYERMRFVFDNIEFCFAEGRLMDVEIFDLLEDLGDRIRRKDIPQETQVAEIAKRIGSRYGFDSPSMSNSRWIRQADSGECRIWIEQQKRLAEGNGYLFGQ